MDSSDQNLTLEAAKAVIAAHKARNPAVIETAVCAEIMKRQEMGVRKYGMELAQNQMPLSQRIQHKKEELMDAVNYAEWSRREAVKMEARIEYLEIDLAEEKTAKQNAMDVLRDVRLSEARARFKGFVLSVILAAVTVLYLEKLLR